MTPNHQLFVDVLVHIESHPGTWNQDDYYPESTDCSQPVSVDNCGTGMCFAGWTCLLSEPLQLIDSFAFRVDSVSDRAAEHLGIDLMTVAKSRLFGGENKLDDLYRISARILNITEEELHGKVDAELGRL